MLSTFDVTDVEWDTDEAAVELYRLPRRFRVVASYPTGHKDEAMDAIVDHLSDEYGWCICNCRICVINEDCDSIRVHDCVEVEG